jgi:inward rectifier potassium channel
MLTTQGSMSRPKLPPSAALQQRRRDRRDGTMTVRVGAYEIGKKGARRYDWRDPYHIALSLSWPGFFMMFVALELALNAFFATLYLLQPGSVSNARPGAISDAFFFSLETLATVGYGVMAPATLYGHIVSAVEIIVGVMFVAIMTGLTFVRFSRPRGKFLWADKAVVASYNGKPTLMVRLANGRAGLLLDANARMAVLIAERTREGHYYRRVHDLKLSRTRLPVFALTWTLMHEVDETSPIWGLDPAGLARADIRMFVAVEAHDANLAADVSDMKDYAHTDVAFGMRYADAVSVDDQGRTIADLGRLSLLEEDNGHNAFAESWATQPGGGVRAT